MLLPALAIADDQKPLQEKLSTWFDMAKSYISSATLSSPIDAGASKVAGLVVEQITNENWKREMLPPAGDPSKGPQEWMVLFSGNTTCHGRCVRVDQAFNVGPQPSFPLDLLQAKLIDNVGKRCYSI